MRRTTPQEKEAIILRNYDRPDLSKMTLCYMAGCGGEYLESVLARHGLKWRRRPKGKGFNGAIGREMR